MSVSCSLIQVGLGTKGLFQKCIEDVQAGLHAWTVLIQAHYDSTLQSDLALVSGVGTLFPLSSQAAPTTTCAPPLTYHYRTPPSYPYSPPTSTPLLLLLLSYPTPSYPYSSPPTPTPLLPLLLPSYSYSSPPTPTPPLLPLLLPSYPYSSPPTPTPLLLPLLLPSYPYSSPPTPTPPLIYHYPYSPYLPLLIP